MSLTRNPWHVREYTPRELDLAAVGLLCRASRLLAFSAADNVMEYYEANRRSVRKITRLDILRLQYRLPRRLLQIPYDILNRMNRRRLLARNKELTAGIRDGRLLSGQGLGGVLRPLLHRRKERIDSLVGRLSR